MKIVFVSVVCDLLHVGHLNFLRAARGLGDWLVVGVLTDNVVASYKQRPIIPDKERLAIVQAIRYVDEAFLQPTLDPQDYLDGIDIIAHGDDWPHDFPGAEYMRSTGREAVNIPYYPHQSTTKIIDKILSQGGRP